MLTTNTAQSTAHKSLRRSKMTFKHVLTLECEDRSKGMTFQELMDFVDKAEKANVHPDTPIEVNLLVADETDNVYSIIVDCP
jgi:hypothetical protein